MKLSVNYSLNREKGLSLIELMIAIAIGLVMLVLLVQIYMSVSNLFKSQTEIERVQENARLSLDQMRREVEAAGYTGCVNSSKTASFIFSDTTTQPINGLLGLRGYENLAAFNTAQLQMGETAVDLTKMQVDGDYAITIKADGPILEVNYMHPNAWSIHAPVSPNSTAPISFTANPNMADNTDFSKERIAKFTSYIISDCTTGELFSAKEQSAATYAGGLFVEPEDTLKNGYGHNLEINGVTYASQTKLAPLVRTFYFLGQPKKGAINGIYNLYEAKVVGGTPSSGGFSAETVITSRVMPNIHQWSISYGVGNGDGTYEVKKYVKHTDTGILANWTAQNWNYVNTVRISLLLTTNKEILTDKSVYYFNGKEGDASDRRLYREFPLIIGIRNRYSQAI